jgi:hypothetical protein
VREAKGLSTITEFNATKRRMPVTQEDALVDFLEESAKIGTPRNHREIRQAADALIREVEGPDAEGVSDSWVRRLKS